MLLRMCVHRSYTSQGTFKCLNLVAPEGLLAALIIPYYFYPTKQMMPQLRCLSFFVFFTELSLQAYSAYQTKNAAFSGIACFVNPMGLNSNQIMLDLQKIGILKDLFCLILG
jgi:hypothetical protein